MLKFSMAARFRGHKQRKLNDHVYSFLLFVSSRPHYQTEFQYSESGRLFNRLGASLYHCHTPLSIPKSDLRFLTNKP